MSATIRVKDCCFKEKVFKADAWQAAVDRFRLTVGESYWEAWGTRVDQVLYSLSEKGKRIHHNREVITGYSYGQVYDWDLYFECIFLSHFGESRFCRNNVETFLDQQFTSGFVPRVLGDHFRKHRQHFKPFLAQTTLLGVRQSGDCRWLAGKIWQKLKAYLDYWEWFSDFDRNGLSVWDSADHSGMDNQVSRAGNIDSMCIEGVDLNVYLVAEFDAMEKLARLLNWPSEVGLFYHKAESRLSAVESAFWSQDDGFYYDRNERTGLPVKVKSVSGFMPLWIRRLSIDRAERLVRNHLLNPDEFWLNYPVASYAKTEPDYYQEPIGNECNWRGTTWVPSNYLIFHGLMRNGFRLEAKELAYKTFDMVMRETSTREYYNAETGSGLGLDPFWGWSALGYLMPLEAEMEYDPTHPNTEILPLGSMLKEFKSAKISKKSD